MFAPAIAVVTLAGFALSGCTTFSDNSAAARVGDTKLSHDDLATLTAELADPTGTFVTLDQANSVIGEWIFNESIRQDLASLDVEMPPAATEMSLAALAEARTAAATAWQALPAPEFSEAELLRRYALGPVAGGLACPSIIVVETVEAAQTALDLVNDGNDFGDVSTQMSIDPSIVQTGGRLQCTTTATFLTSTADIPGLSESILDAEIGDVIGPVESPESQILIAFRDPEDIEAGELETVAADPVARYEQLIRDLDIYVDPRYGTYEGLSGISPLG